MESSAVALKVSIENRAKRTTHPVAAIFVDIGGVLKELGNGLKKHVKRIPHATGQRAGTQVTALISYSAVNLYFSNALPDTGTYIYVNSLRTRD